MDDEPIVRVRMHQIWRLPIWEGEYNYGQIPRLYYDNNPWCLTGTKYVYALSQKRCKEKLLKLYEEELKFVKGE